MDPTFHTLSPQVGNSGMFRPEMLRPMGLPEDVNVIAWGLSLERPTMILYGIDNIRDLFGHKVRMMWAANICSPDGHPRQAMRELWDFSRGRHGSF